MKTLICGSLAYDSIMVFQGRFKEHILPDQVHILNVAFLVPTLRQEFGGVAGNIAYNLALLEGDVGAELAGAQTARLDRPLRGVRRARAGCSCQCSPPPDRPRPRRSTATGRSAYAGFPCS